jgi:hypothetical protein
MAKFEIKDGVVIIPDGTTKIGYDAFKGCTSLESIIIPDSVKEIVGNAFYEYTSLESITIPESVTKIEECAFYGCTSLESIVVADGNPVYDSREGCNAIIETTTNTLIQGCKTTVIPESVTKIGDDAFLGCTSLKSITIPESVTEIGSEAFYDCTSLVTINVPAKKFYYYKERLSEDWHDKIVELAPEKKTKK